MQLVVNSGELAGFQQQILEALRILRSDAHDVGWRGTHSLRELIILYSLEPAQHRTVGRTIDSLPAKPFCVLLLVPRERSSHVSIFTRLTEWLLSSSASMPIAPCLQVSITRIVATQMGVSLSLPCICMESQCANKQILALSYAAHLAQVLLAPDPARQPRPRYLAECR